MSAAKAIDGTNLESSALQEGIETSKNNQPH